jgi:ABC-type antimicrobial peptide transport system permease subunit
VAFAVTMPSLSQAMRETKGKMFPFGFFKLLPVIDHTKMIFIYSVCCFFVIYLVYGIFLVQTMLIATNKLERMSVSAGRDGVSVEGYVDMHTFQMPLYLKTKFILPSNIKLYAMAGAFATLTPNGDRSVKSTARAGCCGSTGGFIIWF